MTIGPLGIVNPVTSALASFGALVIGFRLADVTPGGVSVDPLAASGVTALALAITLLGLFIRGDIVPRTILQQSQQANEDLRRIVDKLTLAFDGRTQLDAARLQWEKEQSVGRGHRREEDRAR